MPSRISDPVQDVSFGTALNISLNNYYDLLKGQVGGLQATEFLQLKLVADPVSINANPVPTGYLWFSDYNLLRRSDLAILPGPISDSVLASATHLSTAYGDFLQKLIKYVVFNNLSSADQAQLDDLQLKIRDLSGENSQLVADDHARWLAYAQAAGISPGDRNQYRSWEVLNGNQSQIQQNLQIMTNYNLQIQKLVDQEYTDPEDKRISDTSLNYNNQMMKMAYPIQADYYYSEGGNFSVEWLTELAGSPTSSSDARFDIRLVLTWEMPLADVKTTTAGAFNATFDKATQSSTSISTDWGTSGSGSYSFIHASANSSDHTTIQNDFDTGTRIDLSAKSAFRLNIIYPQWFDPTLFSSKHITDHPTDFVEFFGEEGSLLYYPTALILVRGFSVSFENKQNWTYDYQDHFSANAGGGFGFCGISFGASGSYTEDTHQHHVDQSDTTLTFSDDENTIRFVGYAVAKNQPIKEQLKFAVNKMRFPTKQTGRDSPTKTSTKTL